MIDREQIVYISCVEDVRYSFVSHLSQALCRKDLPDVFVDCDELLSKESQSKVEGARVSVMILPGNRTVCLDKLVKVLECQKNKDQVVVPVLYGVTSLETEWLSALDLKGFSPVHQSRKECSDSQLVEEIVSDVYEKQFYTERIGIYSKLLEIEKLVCNQPSGIRCVGIWGMPGIGKTTLGKAVFDQMSGDFDACCFVEDYTKAIQKKGLYRLLDEQFVTEMAGAGGTITKLSLLRDKLNNKRVLVVLDDVCDPLGVESFLGGFDWFSPKSLIIITSRDKQVFRLCRVNHIYEVQGLNEKDALKLFLLCASLKEMGEQDLRKLSVKVINYANGNPLAIHLFGRELKGKKKFSEMETAFLKLKRRPPYKIVDAFKSSYDTLSDNEKNIFLDIACFFQGENVEYVLQLLEACGFFPHVGIDVLVEKCLVTISENRVRLHNLTQDVGREIIHGESIQIERRRRLWEPWSIKYLIEYSKHNANGEPKTIFKRAQGSEEIEGIFLDTSNLRFDVHPSAFKNMLNLRLLKIYCSNPEVHPVINFPKGFFRSLPDELRLLHWENYSLESLPQNFDPRHLVEINMPYSQLQKLWGGTKNLEVLRTIRLCHCQHLVDIDDLLKAQNLEVIDLQGCTRLQSFPAAGQLLHLRVVNLSGCIEIKSVLEIPPNIERLHLQGTGILALPLSTVKPDDRELVKFLTEVPGLSETSKLERLASLLESNSSCQDHGKLIFLELKDCSSLRSLPNLANLDLLKVLDLSGCSRLNSIQGFPQFLKELYLAGTAVREVPQLPQSLELLNAHGSCLRSLPNMANLEFLKVLDLSGCSELETIQGFPRNLKELYFAGTKVREVPQLPLSLKLLNAHDSVSLKSICLDSEKFPMHYTFSNIFDLSPQVVNDFLVKALTNIKYIPREYTQELNKAPTFSFSAPSHTNQNTTPCTQLGSSVMTRLNPSWRNTLVCFGMLVEVAFLEDYCDATGFGISCVCRWSNKEGRSYRVERNFHCWPPGKVFPKVRKDHSFVFFDVNMRPSTGEGNDHDIWADLVVFEFFPINQQTKCLNDRFTVTRCGIRVINVATGNTSLENISPVFSLDPTEVSGYEVVEKVLRVNYDDLQVMEKILFLYIACLFNGKDVNVVAPLISGIDLLVSFGLKVLADVSLISVSSNGEIVMHSFLRQMGKEILHELLSDYQSSKTDSLSDILERKSQAKKVVCISATDGGDILGSRYPSSFNLLEDLSSDNKPDTVDSADSALQMAMSQLEYEFRTILIRYTVLLDAEKLSGLTRRISRSFDYGYEDEDFGLVADGDGSGSKRKCNLWVDLINPTAVKALKEIAERMIRAGYEKECVQIYSTVRRDLLDECLMILGVEKLSIVELQKTDWESMGVKIKKWIQAGKITVEVLLVGEKKICDEIFSCSESSKEVCFNETTKSCVMQLLNFGKVAIGRVSPEKLFRILDMYDALANVLQNLEVMVTDCFLCNLTKGLLEALGDTARGIFVQFEYEIRKDPSTRQVTNDEVHSLTHYVMSYIMLVVDYAVTLDSFLENDELDGLSGDDSTEKMSPLAKQILRLIMCLESNLEEKSKFCEDGGLQYVFLMNNIYYIHQKVKDSELGKLLGDDLVRKRMGQVRQYATDYFRASWTMVLSPLKNESMGGSSSGSRSYGQRSNNSSKMALNEIFKDFNASFEELYRLQTGWKVLDPQVREEMKILVSEGVIPAYRAFYERNKSQLEGDRDAGKYIKYTPDDLDSYLPDLFEGTQLVIHHPRRNS